jgi:hypothetical protein
MAHRTDISISWLKPQPATYDLQRRGQTPHGGVLNHDGRKKNQRQPLKAAATNSKAEYPMWN